jgi:hypothetical protein
MTARCGAAAAVLVLAAAGCSTVLSSPVDLAAALSPAAPRIALVAGALSAAGESEWRKETDVGKLEFDEAGLPVVAQATKGQSPASARRWGLRFGFIPEVSFTDPHAGIEYEYVESEPTAGISISLGRRSGRIEFEVGGDVASFHGEYRDFGSPDAGGFDSMIASVRGDLLIYAFRLGSARFYLGFGGRVGFEEFSVWRGFDEANFQNTASGFEVIAGIRMSRVDLRIEHVDYGDEAGVGLTAFVAGLRF